MTDSQIGRLPLPSKSYEVGFFVMRSTEYMDYINGIEWQQIADVRKRIDKHKCQFCGCEGTSENPLQVHHFNYKNLGAENVWSDLVTVCKDCHRGIHRMMARRTNASGRRGWRDDLPYEVRRGLKTRGLI